VAAGGTPTTQNFVNNGSSQQIVPLARRRKLVIVHILIAGQFHGLLGAIGPPPRLANDERYYFFE
jgi:hypothetical protein